MRNSVEKKSSKRTKKRKMTTYNIQHTKKKSLEEETKPSKKRNMKIEKKFLEYLQSRAVIATKLLQL